jgi:hypothetical protein
MFLDKVEIAAKFGLFLEFFASNFEDFHPNFWSFKN